MQSFRKKLRNNKGDSEPLFFIWGLMIVMILLWFSLDLINITWSRYTIKRETQTISRLYALTWVDSVWDPECNETVLSKCEYNNLNETAMADSITKIVESAISNGRYSDFTVMISTTENTSLDACGTNAAMLCVENNGETTTIHGWGPSKIKTSMGYGTTLYMTVKATVPFRFIGEKLGIEDKVFYTTNKFASERFSKIK